jgi:hypothetical protein
VNALFVGEGAERQSREAGEGAGARVTQCSVIASPFPLSRLDLVALDLATLFHKGRGKKAAAIFFLSWPGLSRPSRVGTNRAHLIVITGTSPVMTKE